MAAADSFAGRVMELIRRPFRVAEMIGRSVVATAQSALYKFRSYPKTVDETVPDYEFYDKLRRGKAKGYTLGGLFCKRIEHIFATWIFGRGLTVSLQEREGIEYDEERLDYTNARLAEFVNGLLDSGAADEDGEEAQDRDDNTDSPLMRVFRDALGLGDQYVIVNSDGSLSIPSPNTVTVERDGLDYRQMEAVEIETRTAGYQITDRYEPGQRVTTVKKGSEVEQSETFQNLIGRIPVIHLAHDRSSNETHGHPIHEQLVPLYDEYDDLIYKQIDGAKLLGNPIPVLQGLEDIDATIDANQPAEQDTYTDKDGSTATRTQINLDRNSVLLLGKGGEARMLGPDVGFTEDAKRTLKGLFLLLLEHTGIPEFVWGGELTSARATSETQLTQWVRDIEGRQKDNGGWIVRLCRIWLQVQALTDPRIVVGPLEVEWPELIEEDEQVTLQRLDFALANSLVRRVTVLEQLHLVDDAQAEVDAATEEADERREAMFPDGGTMDFRQDLNQAETEAEGEE